MSLIQRGLFEFTFDILPCKGRERRFVSDGRLDPDIKGLFHTDARFLHDQHARFDILLPHICNNKRTRHALCAEILRAIEVERRVSIGQISQPCGDHARFGRRDLELIGILIHAGQHAFDDTACPRFAGVWRGNRRHRRFTLRQQRHVTRRGIIQHLADARAS